MNHESSKENRALEKEPKKEVGMKLSALTEDILKEIFLLYDQIIGGRVRDYKFSKYSSPLSEDLRYMHEKLKFGNTAEWRFGSRLRGDERSNAKLFIWYEGKTKEGDDKIIRFAFDPNLVSGEEADAMKEEFKEKVEEFLRNRGLAIDLVRR